MLPDTCTKPNEGHKAHNMCIDTLVIIENETGCREGTP